MWACQAFFLFKKIVCIWNSLIFTVMHEVYASVKDLRDLIS